VTGARQVGWDEAMAVVEDGSTVAFSGAVLRGKPVAGAAALASVGRRDLELVAFTGSLEVEILLAKGSLGSVVSSYVGLGAHGPAQGFSAAVAAGTVADRELSEWMLVGGLRAAVMGIPFLPTRAAIGSQLVEERGLHTIRDPYGGDELLAVPALRPDVAFVHAWRADAEGNVQLPWPPDHLADVDVLVARAARTVVVSVEEIVPAELVAASSERTKLFGFEVDLLVEAPGGAWPSSMPPCYDEDAHWLSAHRDRIGDALLAEAAPSWSKGRP
jgi:glutaconate CoA-transferase subunit A